MLRAFGADESGLTWIYLDTGGWTNAQGQGILLQQRDVTVAPDREYMLCVRSAMANADRVMSLFVERQDGSTGGRLIAQKSMQMLPGVLQVGLRLRFCTGAHDSVLRVCAGMKAEPGDELTVSQVILQPLHFVEVVNPHAECGLQRVEQQMVKEVCVCVVCVCVCGGGGGVHALILSHTTCWAADAQGPSSRTTCLHR